MNLIIEETINNVVLNIDETNENVIIDISEIIENTIIEVSEIGLKGDKGDKGDSGVDGVDGKSAYQSAIDGGFIGTELEFNTFLSEIDNKVDKVSGYSLTKNDLTDILKSAYDSSVSWITTNGSNLISHITNYSNPHQTTASQVGSYTTSQVDIIANTKVDKITGKGLSTNDYTTTEQTKLAGIATGAEVNVNADWNSVSGDSQILNKPTIPSIDGLATVTYVDNQNALKVDKVVGKGLSTNDYTNSDRTSLIANASTGVYTFTGLIKTSSTQFSIGAVSGVVVDSGLNYQINFAGSVNNTTPFLTTADSTFVLIKNDSTVLLQATFPTPKERRENIYLGKIIHPDRTTILNVNNTVDFIYSPMSALRDLWSPLKLINDGIVVTPNGANLKINTSAGSLFGNGINFVVDSLSPNSLSVAATVQSTFMYRTKTGGTFTDTTNLDPSYYDVGGVRTLIPGANARATNQRIYLFPTGQLRIQYGQQWYSSLTNAISGIETETFIEYPNHKDNAILIAIVSLVKNASDLTDITDARFNFVSKFGELSGGTGGLSTTTLQQAYDNSIQPEILTDSVLGALTLKRGSASDTDNVFEIQNGSGTNTAVIDGNGNLIANKYTKIGGTSSQFLKADGSVDSSTYTNDSDVVHLSLTEIITGQKRFNPTVSASSAIARGTYLTPTLTATANNDVLVGLDIAPTFNSGGFTNVANLGLRVKGDIFPSTDNIYSIGSAGNRFANIYANVMRSTYYYSPNASDSYFGSSANNTINFPINNTVYGRFHATTGNLTLQNGGTFVDDGVNRLQVTGSVKATGYKIPSGTSSQYLMADGSTSTGGGGGGSMAIGVSITGATAGSVLFAGTAGILQQDNASLFFDDTNNRLGIGTTTLGSNLQINGNAAIGYNSSISAPTNGLAVSGNVVIGSNSTSNSFQITGSKTATAGSLISTLINPTLLASANADKLTAVSINPTYNLGVYTLTRPVALMINGGSGFTATTYAVDIAKYSGGAALGINGEVNMANGTYSDPYPGVAYDLKMGGTGNSIATNGRVSFDSAKINTNGTGSLSINGTVYGSRFQVNGNAAIGYSASTAAPTNGLAISGITLIGTTTNNGTSKFQVNGTINLKNYTVATLPTASMGDIAYVTDALTPAYLMPIVGGGAIICPVFYNGTQWVSH